MHFRNNRLGGKVKKRESFPNSLGAQSRFLVSRARKQAPKPKRAGRSLLCSLLLASAKRRGGQGIPALKRRKPASGKEEPLPFLARRVLFCPGRGPACFRERPLFAEPPENKTSSEIIPFSFSTKFEMIPKRKLTRQIFPAGLHGFTPALDL